MALKLLVHIPKLNSDTETSSQTELLASLPKTSKEESSNEYVDIYNSTKNDIMYLYSDDVNKLPSHLKNKLLKGEILDLNVILKESNLDPELKDTIDYAISRRPNIKKVMFFDINSMPYEKMVSKTPLRNNLIYNTPLQEDLLSNIPLEGSLINGAVIPRKFLDYFPENYKKLFLQYKVLIITPNLLNQLNPEFKKSIEEILKQNPDVKHLILDDELPNMEQIKYDFIPYRIYINFREGTIIEGINIPKEDIDKFPSDYKQIFLQKKFLDITSNLLKLLEQQIPKVKKEIDKKLIKYPHIRYLTIPDNSSLDYELSNSQPNRQQFNTPLPDRQQFNTPQPNRQQFNNPQPNRQQFNNPQPNRQQFNTPQPNRQQFNNPQPNGQQFNTPQPNRQQFNNPQPNEQKIQSGKKFIKWIAEGGFGCVFSPPSLLTPIVKQDYPINKVIDINNFDENYVGKIMNCDPESYKAELQSNMLVKQFDNEGKYTSSMVFAGYMKTSDILKHVRIQKSTSNNDLKKLYNCIDQKLSQINHPYYGYIVSTKVGKSLDKLTNEVTNSNIKLILSSLCETIRVLINNLFIKNYVHGDIKPPNMNLKDNKIYIIDFGFCKKYTDFTLVGRSMNYNYPLILHVFLKLLEMKGSSFATTKKDYINLLNNIIDTNVNNKESHEIGSIIDTYVSQDYEAPFSNIKSVLDYLRSYIYKILIPMPDNVKINIMDVYNNYFLSITKRIDIYSLCLVLNNLLFNNFYNPNHSLKNLLPLETRQLIAKLIKDGLYNDIKDPINLADRLEQIINNKIPYRQIEYF
jgi:hypothetical protein